jgi:hypothetical protein
MPAPRQVAERGELLMQLYGYWYRDSVPASICTERVSVHG